MEVELEQRHHECSDLGVKEVVGGRAGASLCAFVGVNKNK